MASSERSGEPETPHLVSHSQSPGTAGTNTMTPGERPSPELITLDDATRHLVRLAAVIAAGTETSVRDALVYGSSGVPAPWIEELILQSYLFAGFPRALNAMREWRRIAPAPDPATLQETREPPKGWIARGQDTCSRVYGAMYDRLRVNIRSLHPLLDDWMIVEGYGKVLSRPGLDLARRELCIIAACAASRQDRQLHSHLHGALNVGVAPEVITDAIAALDAVIDGEAVSGARLLWARVKGK